MMKKYLPLCLLAACALNGVAVAQSAAPAAKPAVKPAAKTAAPATASATVKVAKEVKTDPMVMANQMMIVFMERMKAGNLKEAREIAQEMVFGNEKFVNDDKKEHKSFHSAMEKELYRILEKRSGSTKEVEWVQQPISDGFYFLAILDFQEGKHEDALANLAQAIFWNPVRSAFYSERGFMLLKKNTGPDFLMAEVAYHKAAELADNNEDFAAALRGLAFVLVEQRSLDQALACLMVSKTFDASNNEAEEEMLFIKQKAPDLFASMTFAKAQELMTANQIPVTFAPEHIESLMALAESYKDPKDAAKAILLLKKAKEMAPKNEEVLKRLKALEKK